MSASLIFVESITNLCRSLAMAELYIATAMVFGPRGPQLQLFETDATSVDFVRDFVMGFPVPSSKGVRVIVKD
jgi:hypothetical protein